MHARIWQALLVQVLTWAALHTFSPRILAENQNRKRIGIEDIFRLEAPRSMTLSPDGSRAVYVRNWLDPNTREERNSLWLVDGDRQRRRPLEPGEPDARSPVFSPDGKWVAFLSTRPRPAHWRPIPYTPPASDPATDIWLLPLASGPAIPLAGPKPPYGRVFNDGFYGHIAFAPDGNSLVFVADDGKHSRPMEHHHIVRPDQGEGYTGYRPAQVWIAKLDKNPTKSAAHAIERLTDDDISYGDPHWSPDGRSIIVHANKTNDRESVRYNINRNFDLWAINVATHNQRQLTFGPGPEVSPRVAPDGKRLACLSVPRKGSHRDVFNLAMVSFDAEQPRLHVLFDHHGPDARRATHPAPVFPLPEECWDGNDFFYYHAERGTGGGLVRLDLSTGQGQFLMPLGGSPPGKPKTVLQRAMRLRKLTPPGNTFLDDRVLAESKVFTWKNDKMMLEGVLTVPPAQVAKPPYPLILYPHGGPHSRSTLDFDFTVQLFASYGYAVFQPNYRGSAGYGQQFIDADRSDFGGGDMRDILTGIDELIRRKIVRPDRQFVYGSSYGGFLTCWLVTQTNRFRAAVAQNAVTDLNMMWHLSDIPSWTQWEFGGFPWEVGDIMRARSPLTHVHRVQTPTLILHSRDDRRCPLPMGLAFHQALVARNVPTQMVVYHDEGHAIRQPLHRADVLRRVLDWFARYDK
jgi:dipeptidyl aminopeptidase/acylaminoacyl peptidase